jgi:hypothetical protein
VEVDYFAIISGRVLGTWIDFAPSPTSARIMDDLVLYRKELKTSSAGSDSSGLDNNAIHNHFVKNHLNEMYMHVCGFSKTEAVTSMAKAVLDKIKEAKESDASQGKCVL